MTNGIATSEPRFVVRQLHAGPWLVVDRAHDDRLVASCPLEDDAHAIAALMSCDAVEALRYAKFTRDRLDVLLPDVVSAGRASKPVSDEAALPEMPGDAAKAYDGSAM